MQNSSFYVQKSVIFNAKLGYRCDHDLPAVDAGAAQPGEKRCKIHHFKCKIPRF